MSLLSTLPTTRRKPPVLVVAGVATLAAHRGRGASPDPPGPTPRQPAARSARRPSRSGATRSTSRSHRSKTEAYVLNDGSVSVINLKTKKQVAEVGTGFQDQTAIGVTNSGNRAYIGTFDENQVKVFNTNTRKVMDTVQVGYGASGITRANTGQGPVRVRRSADGARRSP